MCSRQADTWRRPDRVPRVDVRRGRDVDCGGSTPRCRRRWSLLSTFGRAGPTTRPLDRPGATESRSERSPAMTYKRDADMTVQSQTMSVASSGMVKFPFRSARVFVERVGTGVPDLQGVEGICGQDSIHRFVGRRWPGPWFCRSSFLSGATSTSRPGADPDDCRWTSATLANDGGGLGCHRPSGSRAGWLWRRCRLVSAGSRCHAIPRAWAAAGEIGPWCRCQRRSISRHHGDEVRFRR